MRCFRAVAAGLLCASALFASASAQVIVANSGAAPAVSPNNGSWTETPVSITSANAWQMLVSANSARVRLSVSDTVGLGCKWSYASSPATNQGNVFSLASGPNTNTFDLPTPTNAVYVNCASTGTLTVEAL